jgi:antitoxin (DNA-binding transcriptional repressor) of toxin-antitoxin stability system
MTRVSVDMAQNQLEDLIAAALRGEVVWIVQDEQHAVQLIPAHTVPRHRKFGSAKGLISLAAEFDAPLADFSEYML